MDGHVGGRTWSAWLHEPQGSGSVARTDYIFTHTTAWDHERRSYVMNMGMDGEGIARRQEMRWFSAWFSNDEVEIYTMNLNL